MTIKTTFAEIAYKGNWNVFCILSEIPFDYLANGNDSEAPLNLPLDWAVQIFDFAKLAQEVLCR